MKADSGNIFSSAEAYESYVGRWSRLVAGQFIAWLDIAPGQRWLDVGAGTGVLTEAILQAASPAKIVGVDLSQEYIEFAHQRIRDDRVEFRVGDAADIAFEPPQFDVSVAGLVLNFLPAPGQAVSSMAQAVRGGGSVAAYVWDYGDRMEMMRHFWDAAIKVDASAAEADAGQRFTICKPDSLRSLFQAVDLQSVEVVPIDIQTQFQSFDDYWLPFLGAQGSVSKYLRSIADETRTALRNQLQSQLPVLDDGTIRLVARAWAVKGKREHSV
jgi:ubiquinone/menaquinone biosynthesis C-methylase UbiE